jgi:hypothetical protein
MTAKDELTLKTPDALMNGQAVVDVIQSCVPNIKNAWNTPSIDVDMLLVSIRLASYGEMMEVSHTVPNTEDIVSHNIDLRVVLDQLINGTPWQDTIELTEDITCVVRPMPYSYTTKAGLKTFESQRLLQLVTDDSVGEDQKIEILNSTVATMADLTFNLIVDSIDHIQTIDSVVTDKEFIKEFLQNADKEYFEKIKSHLDKMQASVGIKPLEFESSPENIELGAPKKYIMPITIDQSNFFVVNS